MDRKSVHIGVVGGGVAGVTAALLLGGIGFRVTLFEKGKTLIGGPPFCHLHAGGNLYREISDEQCLTLLRQSIEFAKLYPFCVDRRPTVIAVPLDDEGEPERLLKRLRLLRESYRDLVAKDESFRVLGEPDEYFRLYTKKDMELLAKKYSAYKPKNADEWMAPLARSLNLSKVKYPLILVQEYGLNLFRLSAGVELALQRMESVELLRDCMVTGVEDDKEGYQIRYKCEGEDLNEVKVDYLINAAGFLTGEIDEMLGIEVKRMVEFKAAYTASWPERERYWPEVIFHGKRGTPKGMAQFTPYPGGYVQLHGMSEDITLFKGGLARSEDGKAQPKLPDKFLGLIKEGWPRELIESRTKRAVEFAARFIPPFLAAKPGGPPLFGAQQIPGEDPTLRVAEVSFDRPRYARCEIVKVSSVTDMAEAIVEDLIAERLCDSKLSNWNGTSLFEQIDEKSIGLKAANIAKSRGYPEDMAALNIDSEDI